MPPPTLPPDLVHDDDALARDRARLEALITRAVPSVLPALRARMERDTAETAAQGWIDDAARVLGSMLARPRALSTDDARARLAEALRPEVPPASDAEVQAEGEAFAGVGVRAWIHALDAAVEASPRAPLGADLLPDGGDAWSTITEALAPFGLQDAEVRSWWHAVTEMLRGIDAPLVAGLALAFDGDEATVMRVGADADPIAGSGVRPRDESAKQDPRRRSGDGST